MTGPCDAVDRVGLPVSCVGGRGRRASVGRLHGVPAEKRGGRAFRGVVPKAKAAPRSGPRSVLKSGAVATEKPAGDKKDSPANKPDEGAKADAEPRPASGAAKGGRAEKKADAPALKDPPATGRGKRKDAAGMDEVSEERSGDQPVQADADDASPVPDRVRRRRFARYPRVPRPLASRAR